MATKEPIKTEGKAATLALANANNTMSGISRCRPMENSFSMALVMTDILSRSVFAVSLRPRIVNRINEIKKAGIVVQVM